MANELAAERPVLQTHRQVPLQSAPLRHPLERTRKAVFGRPSLDYPMTLAGFAAEVGEAQ